ncbi:hypothetical protein HK098_002160 [Nowakowskiella sp. JEL0407]|nr:hypothetical protein HK098_002160 [Nowakowskiella sp. JEL0407]
MALSEQWHLWMLADSALPTGGFVASSGLESASQCNFVSCDSVSLFLASSLHNYAFSTVPYLSAVYKAFSTIPISDSTTNIILNRLVALDKSYHASVLNHVAKRASVSQGSAFLSVLHRGFPISEWTGGDTDADVKNSVASAYRKLVRIGKTPGHLPICFAITSYSLGVSLDNAHDLFLFLHARSLISAAIRLNLVGPYQAQSILSSMHNSVAGTLCECKIEFNKSIEEVEFLKRVMDIAREYERMTTGAVLDESDAVEIDGNLDLFGQEILKVVEEESKQTWPLQDILQGLHDRLYSRLFNS